MVYTKIIVMINCIFAWFSTELQPGVDACVKNSSLSFLLVDGDNQTCIDVAQLRDERYFIYCIFICQNNFIFIQLYSFLFGSFQYMIINFTSYGTKCHDIGLPVIDWIKIIYIFIGRPTPEKIYKTRKHDIKWNPPPLKLQ